MNPLLFQIIIAVNAFLVGVVFILAIQHGRAHLKGKKPELPNQSTAATAPQLRQQILAQAQQRYNEVLEQSAATLSENLSATTAELTSTLTEIGSNILDQETKLFGEKLASLRQSSEHMLDGANGTIAQQQAAVQAELEQYKQRLEQDMTAKMSAKEQALGAELAAQKQQLVAALDTKLSDAVSAFLAETLGNEVDLGAQTPYLLQTLEERKHELVQEINDEA